MSKVPAVILELRGRLETVERIDPDGAFYKGVCALLDRASDEALQATADAKIKFVFALAQNRIILRRLRAGKRR